MTQQEPHNSSSKEQTVYLRSGEIQVWKIDLDRPARDLCKDLAPEECKRSESFLTSTDRNRYINSRAAIRFILGEILGVSGSTLKFGKGEHGKPFITHPKSNLEFNLTHCDGMALLAVSADGQVGIDLEYIRPRKSMIKIARRMFSAQKFHELEKVSPNKLPEEFYRLWTEYEAMAKCQGFGIFSSEKQQAGMQSVHIIPESNWIACVAIVSELKQEIKLKYF